MVVRKEGRRPTEQRPCAHAIAPCRAIWFEFFLLVGILATCFIDAFERGRYIFLTYFAMVTWVSHLCCNILISSLDPRPFLAQFLSDCRSQGFHQLVCGSYDSNGHN